VAGFWTISATATTTLATSSTNPTMIMACLPAAGNPGPEGPINLVIPAIASRYAPDPANQLIEDTNGQRPRPSAGTIGAA
jgi:hypothetical protein